MSSSEHLFAVVTRLCCYISIIFAPCALRPMECCMCLFNMCISTLCSNSMCWCSKCRIHSQQEKDTEQKSCPPPHSDWHWFYVPLMLAVSCSTEWGWAHSGETQFYRFWQHRRHRENGNVAAWSEDNWKINLWGGIKKKSKAYELCYMYLIQGK